MSFWISFIGFSAAALTTVTFLPQVIKIIRSRQTRDLSLGMYVTLVFGVGLWLTYGLLTRDAPVIVANLITFALVLWILILKIKHG